MEHVFSLFAYHTNAATVSSYSVAHDWPYLHVHTNCVRGQVWRAIQCVQLVGLCLAQPSLCVGGGFTANKVILTCVCGANIVACGQ